MPWNPMRVEQRMSRIDRIDRIRQLASIARVHNFYYDKTIEAKVSPRLRDRSNAFQSVVGNLQPILAQMPTFLKRAIMNADPDEKDVLLSEFDEIINAPPLRLVDDLVAMDVAADLVEISEYLEPSPISKAQIEKLFLNSNLLKSQGVTFKPVGVKI